MVENSINLCDILSYLWDKDNHVYIFDEIEKKYNLSVKINRIFIGSYFCSQYFLNLSLVQVEEIRRFCLDNNMKITLVVPIFSQKKLKKGKAKIKEILLIINDFVDEITVNDLGMLAYIQNNYNVLINLGRLFFKEYRDIRYAEFFDRQYNLRKKINYLPNVDNKYIINYTEIDPISKSIFCQNVDTKIAVHYPFCYISVGQICEFASIHNDFFNKFISNQNCQNECQKNMICYKKDYKNNNIQRSVYFYKIGRAIYFLNKELKLKNFKKVRMIYFPMELKDLKIFR